MSRMSTLYTICTDEDIYVRNRGRGMAVALLMHIWAVITHLLKKKEKKRKASLRVLSWEKNELIW